MLFRKHLAVLAAAAALTVGGRWAHAQDAAALRGAEAPANAIWLDSLDISKTEQGWNEAQAGKSVDGKPITLKGDTFARGLGTHANSDLLVDLKGAAVKFVAVVGIDDETEGKGSASFEVWADGKKLADSGVLKGGQAPKLLTADLTGARQMRLVVNEANDGISYDHADWAGAALVLAANAAEKPVTMAKPQEPAPPIIHAVSPKPAFHGPRVTGTTPGRPFLFLVPATGQAPLAFSAKNLPEGLTLDEKTGIITGSVKQEGEYVVDLTVKNGQGEAARKLKIVAGPHKLAQTPPMGWNSWNCWAGAVDDAKVRAAADAMVKSGLAAHGFQYINIDDCWEDKRDANGEIVPNSKFPDMKALSDYVHSKGLKLGIYSSPGPKTCAGFVGSWQHEEQDAKTWAKWGIDYIKYDWCSYSEVTAKQPKLEDLQRPYRVMRQALDKVDRDITYSLCQYGWGKVWEWGAEVGGNLWRTTGDITDTWSSMSNIGFSQADMTKYAGPGHWNDPDMLVVGKVGWSANLHPTKLTPNEQITHISLWCLQSAPLLIGCDMSSMDEFTVALLTNTEVLDVNQDPLGKAAARITQDGSAEVWARPLYDGTIAVGFFNRGYGAAKIKANWSDLKIQGSQPVRDLWQHKDLGNSDGSFEVEVPTHGAVLVKIGTPKAE